MEGVMSSFDQIQGLGSSPTLNEPLRPWNNDPQDDSLPFFNMDFATQWQGQDDFGPLDLGHVHVSTTRHEEPLPKVSIDANPKKLEAGATCFISLPTSFTLHCLILSSDMNDPKVLDIYIQLAFFQKEIFSQELLFASPDHALQHLIHILARKLDLE